MDRWRAGRSIERVRAEDGVAAATATLFGKSFPSRGPPETEAGRAVSAFQRSIDGRAADLERLSNRRGSHASKISMLLSAVFPSPKGILNKNASPTVVRSLIQITWRAFDRPTHDRWTSLSFYRRRYGLCFGGSVPVIARCHAASACARALAAATSDCPR